MLLFAILINAIGLAAIVTGLILLDSEDRKHSLAGGVVAVAGAAIMAFFGLGALINEFARLMR